MISESWTLIVNCVEILAFSLQLLEFSISCDLGNDHDSARGTAAAAITTGLTEGHFN